TGRVFDGGHAVVDIRGHPVRRRHEFGSKRRRLLRFFLRGHTWTWRCRRIWLSQSIEQSSRFIGARTRGLSGYKRVQGIHRRLRIVALKKCLRQYKLSFGGAFFAQLEGALGVLLRFLVLLLAEVCFREAFVKTPRGGGGIGSAKEVVDSRRIIRILPSELRERRERKSVAGGEQEGRFPKKLCLRRVLRPA